MATAWGVSPDDQGNGTTPEDFQRIIAAQYQNAGIVGGAVVSGTATMSFTITAGAVVIDTGHDMAVIAPVPVTTITTDPAPATGSRTDTIWIKQNFPGTDGASNAYVGITIGGTTVPSNAIMLQQYRINAGITATSAATPIGNRKFAIQTGASKGRLFRSNNSIDGNGVATKGTWTRNAGSFYVPTDRDVEINLKSTAVACTSTGATYPRPSWNDMAMGSIMYKFYVDGTHVMSWERTINGFYETKPYSFIQYVTEGTHTVHYTTEFQAGPADMYFKFVKGGAEKWIGDEFSVWDRGAVVN